MNYLKNFLRDNASHLWVIGITIFFAGVSSLILWNWQTHYLEKESAHKEEIRKLQEEIDSPLVKLIEIPTIYISEEEAEIIGLRNNNPCNVKGQGWQGQIGSDKFGHAIFEAPEWGLRAAAMVLITYQRKHKLNTLRKIVDRYAEGNNSRYTKFLAKELGISETTEINILYHLPELLKAMVKFETGKQPYPDSVFALASIYKKLQ